MQNFSKLAMRRTGLWLALGTLLFVAGWHLWVIASQHHLLAVASEVGSVPQFREKMFASGDGSSLVFYRETESGLGAYFCEIASGKLKLLCEQQEKGFSLQCGMLGWSPDSRYFAIGNPANVDKFDYVKSISIYDSKTVTPVASLSGDGFSWDSKFIWLSSHSFARTTHNQAWLVYEQMPDGQWLQTQVVNKFVKDDYLNNLVVTSPHAVAWEQDNEIWTHDLTTGVEMKIWPSTNTLYGFTHDDVTGDFLLNAGDKGGPLTIRFRPPRFGERQGAILETSRGVSRTRWVGLHIERGIYSFTIMTGADPAPIRFDWDGMVEDYKLAGDYLYFVGNRAGETPGIWQYDLRDKKVRCLASNPKREFKLVKTTSPSVGTAMTAQGRQISYHLWKPEKISAGKKYPLIIGQTHYIWNPYQQVAPEAGYYYAAVDRATWADNIDNWPEDVLELRDILAKDPDIDTNRIFLTAFSDEARDVIQVLAVRPGICKGLILFNPGAEPDLSQTRLSRMLVFGGKDDDVGIPVAQLEQYQDTAAKAGVPVTLIIQEGAQHIVRSAATERERTRQFAKFLLEN
jgi:hypothetical protein